MKTDIYNAQGKKAGSLDLPESMFGVKWNDSLMHQVVISMQSNARPNVAHTKGRGEVRGGGRKPWQQKGTGRARHGSTRSPIWRGGGVTHGPSNEKNYMRVIPKKMRAKALFMALSQKFKDGELILIDSFGISAPKTAAAKKTLALLAKNDGLTRLGTKKTNTALIALSSRSDATEKSFRNIGNVETMDIRSLNPLAVLGKTYIIIENPQAGIAVLEHRVSKKQGAEVEAPKPKAPRTPKKSTQGGSASGRK